MRFVSQHSCPIEPAHNGLAILTAMAADRHDTMVATVIDPPGRDHLR
jgi:hypothetical protein